MKKKFLGLFLVLCVALFANSYAYALEVAEVGDTVISEGEYDATRFIAGNKVTDTSKVDGLSLIAGNEIILEGTTTYGLYAGNSLNLKGIIEKDLFIAGNAINILEDANVGRDAYVAGNAIKISATIGRNLNVGGMSVNLAGAKINGDVYIGADAIALDETTEITGKLTYNEDARVSGLDEAIVGSVETTKARKDVKVKKTNPVYDFIISSVAAYVVMLVFLLLLPRAQEKIDNLTYDSNHMFKYLATGLGVLFIVPIIAILGVFTVVLTPISIITLLVYGVSIYLAYLTSYYVVGHLITTKLIKKESMYLALAIGIVVVKLLLLIPIVGEFASIICLLYGLGLIFYFIISRGK